MRRAKRTLGCVVCSVAMAGAWIGLLASAADALTIRYWTGATDQNWSESGNWTSGVPNPGAWDQVVFDSNATANLATNCDISSGGSGFDKITLSNPAGNVSINTTYVFGIGDGGIDMSSATSDLTINAYISLLNGDSTPLPMDVAAGRTLSLTQDVVGSWKTIEKRGEGKLILGGGSSDSTDNNFQWLDVLAGTVELNKASSDSPHAHAAGNVGTLNGGATVKLTGTGDYQVFQGGSIYITGGTFDLNGKNQTGATTYVRNTSSKLLNSAAGVSVFSPLSTVLQTGGLTVETVGDIQYDNDISGSYGLTKTGAGKLTLTGAGSYTGETTVSAGTLQVDGSIDGAGGDLTVAGGTLAGSGSIARDVIVSTAGYVAPGSSVGELTISGNVTFDGVYQWELASLVDNGSGTPGVDWDVITLSGGSLTGTDPTISLTGLAPSGDAFWTSSHVWTTVADAGSITLAGGGVIGYTPGEFGNFGVQWGGSPGNLQLQLTWTPIPEPGAFMLLALGLSGLLVYAWRKR